MTYSLLIKIIREKIIESPLEDSLRIAKLYGSLLWYNQNEIFIDKEVEDILFQRFVEKNKYQIKLAPDKNQRLLHVLTDGYDSGGHTRVVERLLSVKDAKRLQDVLITGLCNRVVENKLKNLGVRVRTVNYVGIESVLKISAIMSEYSAIVLHINPDDIAATLASRLVKSEETRVGMYNHADHCFTFGACSVDVLLEIGGYGDRISSIHRIGVKRSFAGIPLDFPETTKPRIRSSYFLTSGPLYKFDFRQGSRFAILIERLVTELKLSCIIIGFDKIPENSSSFLKKLIKTGKIEIIKSVPHDDYKDYINNCRFYLDSSPICGASAFPEAFLNGRPVLGLLNQLMGYTPLDQFRFASVEDLIKAAKKLAMSTPNSLICTDKELYKEINYAHSASKILERIDSALFLNKSYEIPKSMRTEQYPEELNLFDATGSNQTILRAPGMDWLTVRQRCLILFFMVKFGMISKAYSSMGAFNLTMYFLSNVKYRRFRNLGIRRYFRKLVDFKVFYR